MAADEPTEVTLVYEIEDEESGRTRTIRYPVEMKTSAISKLILLMDELAE